MKIILFNILACLGSSLLPGLVFAAEALPNNIISMQPTAKEKYESYCKSKSAKVRSAWNGDLKLCSTCKELKHYTFYSFTNPRKEPGSYGIASSCRVCIAIKEKKQRREAVRVPSGYDLAIQGLNGMDRLVAASKYKYPHKWEGDQRICISCKEPKDVEEYCSNEHIPNKDRLRLSSSCKACKYKDDLKRYNERTKYKIATRTERISKDKVYQDYNHHCNLCGIKTIAEQYKYNSRNADHIIPMHKGGTHTYDNLQLLCMECNLWKSDRILSEQEIEERKYYRVNNKQLAMF